MKSEGVLCNVDIFLYANHVAVAQVSVGKRRLHFTSYENIFLAIDIESGIEREPIDYGRISERIRRFLVKER